MVVTTFTGGAFAENGYLVACGADESYLVIDPGASAPEMVDFLQSRGATVAAILLTHAHLDHVEGIPAIRAYAPDAPIYLHPTDLPMYAGVQAQAAAFGMTVPALPAPDRELAAGDVLTFGEVTFEVRFTPGHAPGHVVFYAPADGLCLAGDVVFAGSVGRTDLPGGDWKILFESIRGQVLTLPDETRLLTGHGPETTVGHERRTNPFLIPHYGGELV